MQLRRVSGELLVLRVGAQPAVGLGIVNDLRQQLEPERRQRPFP